ncbi:MAG: phosphatidate cytidylyltransferase [Acidimicrobiaceae bacterium]|nr:phosphatidate cytidylyltransferase [Acidimicrobiaceae bacterium]
MKDRDDGPDGPGDPRSETGETGADEARASSAQDPSASSGTRGQDTLEGADDVEAARPGRAPGSVTEGVRIAAVEAAVAAGLAPSTGRRYDVPVPGARDDEPAEQFSALELPDWSDPPTGQVPRVLLVEAEDGTITGDVPTMRGPTWREDRSDWDEDLDLSFLVEEEGTHVGIAGHASEADREEDQFDFSFRELDVRAPRRHEDTPARRPVSETQRSPVGEIGRDVGDASELSDDIDDAAWDSLMSPDTTSSLDDDDDVASRSSRRAGRKSRSRLWGRHHAPEHAARHARDDEVAQTADVPAGFDGEPAPSWTRRDRSPARARRSSANSSATTSSPTTSSATTSSSTTSSATTSTPEGARRNPLLATATGIVAGGIAIACFVAGPVLALVLVTVLVTLAAGEAYGALRRGGQQPATLLGLVAVPALVVSAYLRGSTAIPVVLGIAVLVSFCWYLLDSARSGSRRHPVTNLGGTLLVVVWVGFLGSFAGLILDPTAFPHRHGVALLGAAVLLTVAADVGAYATGSKFGKHLLAPRISPHKSWEGLAGGAVLTLAIAALVVARIHPFSMSHALLLGLVVAVVAPIGDLAESLIKRDLGVKDMGSLLPAHGGVLDRVDAMLFVLPVAYYVVRLVHLS